MSLERKVFGFFAHLAPLVGRLWSRSGWLELKELVRVVVTAELDRFNLAHRLSAALVAQASVVPPELTAEDKVDPPKEDKIDSPESEEQGLIGFLARDQGRADLAVSLVRVLREQGRTVDSVLGLDGWCLTTDPQTRALEPFIFMHIPKTAGSVMRLIVLSLFDQSRVFPGRNYEDYNPRTGQFASTLDPERHGVFVGHMKWDAIAWIQTALRCRATIFTVLREPVDHYRSQMSFTNELVKNGESRTIREGRQHDFGTFWDDTTRNIFGPTLVETQVSALLASRHPYVEYFRYHGSDPAYSARPDEDKIERARALLTECLDIVHVAFFEDLRRSLDLCCKTFGLPHQMIPGVRLNRSFADHSKGLSPAQLALVESKGSLAFEFHAAAWQRFEAEYQAAFAGIDDVPAHLNDAYRAALLAKLKPHWCVHLTADCAWPGHGWGHREENEHGQRWRQLGPDGRATIIVRLRGGCDFFVSLTIYSAGSEALARVSAAANGVALPKEGTGFIDGSYVLNWIIPAACLAETDGSVDLVFDLPGDGAESPPFFAIEAVSLYPARVA